MDKEKGAGNSTITLNYSIRDANPYPGTSHYRLRQVDYDGTATYSDIVSVRFNFNPDFSFNVYPNPNDGTTFTIAVNATTGENVNVVIYDLSEKEIFSNIIVTQHSGPQVYIIEPLQKLAPGIYMIIGSLNQKVQSKRLFVQ